VAFFAVEDFFEAVRFVLPLLFFVVLFFEAVFFEDEAAFFVDEEAFFDPDDFFAGGTFPPSRRASESPMAMACFRLVTFFPDPLFSVPRLYLCISVSTLSDAFFPYLLAMQNLLHKVMCNYFAL
jgi:hypothetical protein